MYVFIYIYIYIYILLIIFYFEKEKNNSTVDFYRALLLASWRIVTPAVVLVYDKSNWMTNPIVARTAAHPPSATSTYVWSSAADIIHTHDIITEKGL